MTADGAGVDLLDRERERGTLDDLLAAGRAGRNAVLVLWGEAGIGKSELLNYLVDRASDFRVLRVAGAQDEMELPYAGLHQLCSPLLPGLDHIPEPQLNALATAFGLREGAAPDRFLVSLAALSLLADSATRRPLLCVVDDVQWLDRASAQALAFVARRLLAEPIVLVFAGRESAADGVLVGLPKLHVRGLPEHDSLTLLRAVVRRPLEREVRDRILLEARGNPLALLELPRGLTVADPTDARDPRDRWSLANPVERGFLRRFKALPIDARRLLLIAAAEPLGDMLLLRKAAAELDIDLDDAASAAEASGLVVLSTRVRFRHPLVRSTIYHSATTADRRDAHQALADSIDLRTDPDRKVWHRAHAATGEDEGIASELEEAARRAQARGGVASAAAVLERSATLTPDPARRSARALMGAQAKLQAGEFESASALVAMAQIGPLDPQMSALVDALRAGIAFAEDRGNEATPLLLDAARRLELIDVQSARETYLEAIAAATFAGGFARGAGLREVGEAARQAPASQAAGMPDRLLDALSVRLMDGRQAAAPMMASVLDEVRDGDVPVSVTLRWQWLLQLLAADLSDYESYRLLASRHVVLTREAGALSDLTHALDVRGYVHVLGGELSEAAAVSAEVSRLDEVTGGHPGRILPVAVAVYRGQAREAREGIARLMEESELRGQGAAFSMTAMLHAVLCNSLCQHQEALTAATTAAEYPEDMPAAAWGLVELVEAASRSGADDTAADALKRIAERAQATRTTWALGVEARSRALLSHGMAAEAHYKDAIQLLTATRARMDLARAHLVYGEWLNRENRFDDARTQLTTAHQMMAGFGAKAFAERAARELAGTGVAVRPIPTPTTSALTSQEEQIARLAADGLTNPEIGARVYLSRHTVEWHLRKVYSKLGIGSRRQIAAALPKATTVI